MTKYRITAPDGRKYLISGGKTPPTSAQIRLLIENYRQPAEEPAFSLKPLTAQEKEKAAALAKVQRPQGFGALDIAKEGVKGFGQGVVSGLGRAASGATLGATDWLDRKTGGHLASLDADLQRSAESAGLGGWNKAAKFASELGGNMQGAGGGLLKTLGKTGLKGLKLASFSGGLEGAAYGATGSDSLKEVLPNMGMGMGWGVAMPLGMAGAGYVGRKIATPFSSRLMTEGMQGGLSNVANNPDAVKLLRQGIKNNDDVAENYLNRVLPELRGINRETAEMVNNSLTSRINVPETIAAERARYGDYIAKHGDDEVMNFAPTREQLASYKAQSSFNPNKYTREQVESVLRDRAEKSGIEIGGDLGHFSKRPDRTETVRTLSNTLENPDIVYSKGDKGYVVKKYDTNGKPFFDFITKKDGKLWTKFPTNPSYLENQIKNSAENVSLSGRVTGVQPGLIHSLPPTTMKSIPLRNVVVNSKLPNVSTLYEGLTPWQMGQLDKALKTGFSKTNAKAGSLESLNKVKQEINEMISKAQSTDKLSEVWQLQELKGKFDNAMPKGLKYVDAGFARAKRLEDAFDRGTHYNPNNVTGSDMIAGLAADEQNAFTQGLFKRMTNNSLTRKNLAEDALKYENTLAQVLPTQRYNPLIEGLNNQSTRFGRLSELGRVAESRLRVPEGTRIFGREQLESEGSMIGSVLDWANNLLSSRANRRAALNLLDPNFVGRSPVESWVVRNPNLAAGLSSAAFNNLINR